MNYEVQFILQNPAAKSHLELQELLQIWHIPVVKLNTKSRIVDLLFEADKFKKMFGFEGKKGEIKVPDKLKSFVGSIKIIGKK